MNEAFAANASKLHVVICLSQSEVTICILIIKKVVCYVGSVEIQVENVTKLVYVSL